MSSVQSTDSERLAVYNREVALQRIKNRITALLVIFFVLSIALLYSGQGLYNVLRVVGLESLFYSRSSGIDCRSELNADSDRCNPRMSHGSRSWRNLDPGRGKGAAFSLNGR